jgi:hypothetical protein
VIPLKAKALRLASAVPKPVVLTGEEQSEAQEHEVTADQSN